MAAGSLIGGKYRLTRQIGEGAMGVVWAAVNELTSREVAIKLILKSTPDLRHRLLREAKACGSLSHRNIIEVLDVGQNDNGDPFLVMPLLHGETLAELLARQFRLDVPVAAQIARDVARALAAAHAATIIHRDLKPANIFLHQESGTDGLVVKVLDFGVSKNLSAQASMETAVGGAVGSPAYMSPEQIRAPRDINPRSDIWSLGVVLFEMLSGRRPVQGEPQGVMEKILRGDIPRVSKFVRNLDPALDAVVAHCLQMDRDRRMSSAAELAKLLNRYVGSNENMRIIAELPQRTSSPSGLGAGATQHLAPPSPEHGSPVPSAHGPGPSQLPQVAGAQQISSSPLDPSTPAPSAHVGAPSQLPPIGGTTEKLSPSELDASAHRQGFAPHLAESSGSVAEQPLSNINFDGETLPLQPRPAYGRAGAPRSTQPVPGTLESHQTPARGATTEKLDPADFAAWTARPSPQNIKGSSTTLASAVGPEDAEGTSSAAAMSPELARGGTVKIPFRKLPQTSPLLPAIGTGPTTSTAPVLRRSTQRSATDQDQAASVAVATFWKELPYRVRIAVVATVAALTILIVCIGLYAIVYRPTQANTAAQISAPTQAPTPVRAPIIENVADEITPPSTTALTAAPSETNAPLSMPTPTSKASSSPAAAIKKQSPPIAPPFVPGNTKSNAVTSKCGKIIKSKCLPENRKYNPAGF